MESVPASAPRQDIRDAFAQISHLPFPVYVSDTDGNFLFVNPKARQFFGLEAGQSLEGCRIGDYYDDIHERELLLNKIRQVEPDGWLEDLTVRLHIQHEHHKVRFASRPFFDTDHQLVALLCIADSMSDRTLEANFSAVLHTYIATINGLRDTLNMLIKGHGHGIRKNDGGVHRLLAAAELVRHRHRFETLFAELTNIAEARGIDSRPLTSLQKYWHNLAATKETEKDNAAWGRRNLIEIRKSLENLKSLPLPRELLKNSRAEVDEMLRLTSMISISISVDEINERIPDFYYFRNYLLRGEANQQEMKPTNVVPLLHDAIQHLEEFAAVNKVSIVQHFNPKEVALVQCHRSSLSRALHSILHNAIKYSWSKRPEDRPPWIDVRLEKKAAEVDIIVENWGVPIRREELEDGKIFQFGRRGRESEDRGRAGTGIGLYDAFEVVKEHGGHLHLSSEPTFGNQQNIYTNPFITKAFITLPILPEK